MDILSAVSETALITLKARVQEAEKDEPVIRDEVKRMTTFHTTRRCIYENQLIIGTGAIHDPDPHDNRAEDSSWEGAKGDGQTCVYSVRGASPCP